MLNFSTRRSIWRFTSCFVAGRIEDLECADGDQTGASMGFEDSMTMRLGRIGREMTPVGRVHPHRPGARAGGGWNL